MIIRIVIGSARKPELTKITVSDCMTPWMKRVFLSSYFTVENAFHKL